MQIMSQDCRVGVPQRTMKRGPGSPPPSSKQYSADPDRYCPELSSLYHARTEFPFKKKFVWVDDAAKQPAPKPRPHPEGVPQPFCQLANTELSLDRS